MICCFPRQLAFVAALTLTFPSLIIQAAGIDSLTGTDSPLAKGEVIAFFGDSITQGLSLIHI